MTLTLRRAGYVYEVQVLQRILAQNREAYITALREADDGDFTQWVLFLVQAIRAALIETQRLKGRV